MNALLRKAGLATALAAASAGTVVALSTPAQAATSVRVCVGRQQTDSLYRDYPISLYRSDSSGRLLQWLRSGKTGQYGCGTFYNTGPNMYLRAAAPCAGRWYYSPSWANPGHYVPVDLGTIKVPC